MTTTHDLASRPHALYRFFGAGGTLLYIGITADLPTRLTNHRDEKAWWLGVTNVTVEHYPDRASVLEAERRAIATERPLYNSQHNQATRPGARPARGRTRRSTGWDTRVVHVLNSYETIESRSDGKAAIITLNRDRLVDLHRFDLDRVAIDESWRLAASAAIEAGLDYFRTIDHDVDWHGESPKHTPVPRFVEFPVPDHMETLAARCIHDAVVGDELSLTMLRNRLADAARSITKPCPACGRASLFVRQIDRYVHEDGTGNDQCWLSILRGGRKTKPRKPAAPDQLTPVCMGCEKQIPKGNKGVVHVSNVETHAWMKEATAREQDRARRLFRAELIEDPDERQKAIFDASVWHGGDLLGPRHPTALWMVHCDRCNPHYDEDSDGWCGACYWFSVDRCRTWAQLVHWTGHLSGKRWLRATNWTMFIEAIANGTTKTGLIASKADTRGAAA